MTTPSLGDWKMPTVTSYTSSRATSGPVNLTGSGSVWLPLPTGVSAIQITGYGDAKLTVSVSTGQSSSGTIARRELDCTLSGASTVLSGVGRKDGETRFLYIGTTAAVQVSAVITTFPM